MSCLYNFFLNTLRSLLSEKQHILFLWLTKLIGLRNHLESLLNIDFWVPPQPHSVRMLRATEQDPILYKVYWAGLGIYCQAVQLSAD